MRRERKGGERKRKKQFKIVGPVIPNGRQRTMANGWIGNAGA